MQPDILELRDFYDRPLGSLVRRVLSQRIRARWPRLPGATLIGVGYAVPYLGSFRSEAARIGALMPATQGAIMWPPAGGVCTALYEEEMLPLPDASVDNLLVVHCLEGSGQVRKLLRELWRVLKPEGSLIIIVPNRRGVWARTDTTPFGHGQPYSPRQLERALEDALFSPIDWSGALFMAPVDRAFVRRTSFAIERIGARIWPVFAGVIVVEARKELTSPIGTAAVARRLPQLVPARGATRAGADVLNHKRDAR
ncbi:MAG: methyltransferase domain-containing protein [Hyphomicrobiaceae bacterium]